jgi:phosphoribosylamine--glycine ligase
MMNILLLGSGGREHAMAWKISQSAECGKLYIAPGNAGTANCGINVPLSPLDFPSLRSFVIEKNIDMLVVGPEDPLVKGVHDYFLAEPALKHIPVIGPVASAARLEGSKDFSKSFMQRHGIPTAAYRSFTESGKREAMAFMETMKAPYVLKADGLAAGKGVLILDNLAEAERELNDMFSGKFGNAGNTVVIEQFLKGIELSVFVLTDGKGYCILPEAKDYKRIGEGDTGLNTGGMGSVSCVPFADQTFMKKVEDRIIKPTVEGLAAEEISYKGFIFFGLIKVGEDPMVIEYNARMGDPETESVMPRLRSDLLEMFAAVASDRIGSYQVRFDPRQVATVMMVSGGYPGAYEKGKRITGLDTVTDSMVFHAGTRFSEDRSSILTDGGRVLAVTSYGETMQEALARSYRSVNAIRFDGACFRKDIGFDLL